MVSERKLARKRGSRVRKPGATFEARRLGVELDSRGL